MIFTNLGFTMPALYATPVGFTSVVDRSIGRGTGGLVEINSLSFLVLKSFWLTR